MDNHGVGGFKADPVTQSPIDNSEVKKKKNGINEGQKGFRQV